MKEMLYEVRCLKSNDPRIISSFDFKHLTSYNISFIKVTIVVHRFTRMQQLIYKLLL